MMNMKTTQFLAEIFGDSTGTLCIARKGNKFQEVFVEWPSQISKLDKLFSTECVDNLYYTPALLTGKSRSKENFKSASVLWVDIDGDAPDYTKADPRPSIVVKSSHDDKQHWYWKLEEPCTDVAQLEAAHRGLVKKFGGDPACVDGTHLMRPVGTKNFKYDVPKDVEILDIHEKSYRIENLAPKGTPSGRSAVREAHRAAQGVPRALPPYVAEALTRPEVDDRSVEFYRVAKDMVRGGHADESIKKTIRFLNNQWLKDGKKHYENDKNLSRDVSRLIEKVSDELDEEADLMSAIEEVGDRLGTCPQGGAEAGHSSGEAFSRLVGLNRGGADTFAEVEIKNPDWLVTNMWQIGALNALTGPSESGKSTYASGILAKATQGEHDGLWEGQKLNVGVFSSAEVPETTTARQLMSYGADLNRVFIYRGPKRDSCFTVLSAGLHLKEWLVEKGIKVLLIDPITSFLADGDMFNIAKVRRTLDPLSEIAKELQVCIIYIAHHKKGAVGDLRERVNGSTAFIDVPRTHWAIIPEVDRESGKPTGGAILSCDKLSEGIKRDTENYELTFETVDLGNGIKGSRLKEEPTETSVYDIMSANRAIHREVEEGKREKKVKAEDAIVNHLRAFNGLTLQSIVTSMLPEYSAGTLSNAVSRSKLIGSKRLPTAQSKCIWYLTEKFDSAEAAAADYIAVNGLLN